MIGRAHSVSDGENGTCMIKNNVLTHEGRHPRDIVGKMTTLKYEALLVVSDGASLRNYPQIYLCTSRCLDQSNCTGSYAYLLNGSRHRSTFSRELETKLRLLGPQRRRHSAPAPSLLVDQFPEECHLTGGKKKVADDLLGQRVALCLALS